MSSVRQQIVEAMQTRLGLIAADYVFTLNDGDYTCTVSPVSVSNWRRVPYTLNQVPAIAFWDTAQSLGEGPFGRFEHRLEVSVAGYVAGSASIDSARALLADICAAIGSDPRWGGLAKWTEITDQNIRSEQEGDIITGCQCTLIVVYETSLWRM